MGILDPLFSLRQFTCRSFFGFQEKREKESASGDSLLSFQRSPRVYNNYFCYYGFFFSWNPWGNLCLGERERVIFITLFSFTLGLILSWKGPVVQMEEWQEKVAYIQSYLAQTKDIDTQSFTTETSDSGISRSHAAPSELGGPEEASGKISLRYC